jgi:hypothetical protein
MTKRRVAWIAAAILGVVGIAGALWSTITGGRIVLTATNVAIEGDRLVITVSLMSLTRTVALFLGLLLLALILLAQLCLHPGWGIGLLADASDASPVSLILMVVFLGLLVPPLVVLGTHKSQLDGRRHA